MRIMWYRKWILSNRLWKMCQMLWNLLHFSPNFTKTILSIFHNPHDLQILPHKNNQRRIKKRNIFFKFLWKIFYLNYFFLYIVFEVIFPYYLIGLFFCIVEDIYSAWVNPYFDLFSPSSHTDRIYSHKQFYRKLIETS